MRPAASRRAVQVAVVTFDKACDWVVSLVTSERVQPRENSCQAELKIVP